MYKPTLKKISKSYFENKNIITIDNKFHKQNFYIIEYNKIEIIKFCSMSDILPELFLIDENTVMVGIDLQLFIYDLKKNFLTLNIELDSYYFFSFKEKNNVISVSQSEIIFFNEYNYLQYQHVYLHDIYVSHKIEKDCLIVNTIENCNLEIDIPMWGNVS